MVTAVYESSNTLSIAATGRITVHTSRTAFSWFAVILTVFLLLVMLVWERTPSYSIIFLLAVGVGASNGMFLSLSASMFALLYINNSIYVRILYYIAIIGN